MNTTNAIKCIYIPRISLFMNEQMVIYEIEQLGIGIVNRVDFTELNKKPGFLTSEENTMVAYKSAFVHIDLLYENGESIKMINAFNRGTSYKFYPMYIKEYWMLLPAKNPIPETMMNIHQVVENCRFLEEKIKIQETVIAEQSLQIHRILEILQLDKKTHYFEENDLESVCAACSSSHIDEMVDFDDENNDENESVSTHSSMPSLVSIQSEERIKASYDLCGNA